MTGYRHCDRRFPFLWEGADQPPGRWHAVRKGPAHYFADTPDGAWAEFLRHEEITDAEDLATIDRALWAVELPDGPYAEPRLGSGKLTGGFETYGACQAEARRLLATGVSALQVPSAALQPGGAHGWSVDGGLRAGPARDGIVRVLFGLRPNLIGWRVAEGRPGADLLERVRHFADAV